MTRAVYDFWWAYFKGVVLGTIVNVQVLTAVCGVYGKLKAWNVQHDPRPLASQTSALTHPAVKKLNPSCEVMYALKEPFLLAFYNRRWALRHTRAHVIHMHVWGASIRPLEDHCGGTDQHCINTVICLIASPFIDPLGSFKLCCWRRITIKPSIKVFEVFWGQCYNAKTILIHEQHHCK